MAWNLESKDRNLPQCAGTSCRVDTGQPEANAVAESTSSTFESRIQTTESNERNLSQIAGDLRSVVRNSGRPEADQMTSLPWRRASFCAGGMLSVFSLPITLPQKLRHSTSIHGLGVEQGLDQGIEPVPVLAQNVDRPR